MSRRWRRTRARPRGESRGGRATARGPRPQSLCRAAHRGRKAGGRHPRKQYVARRTPLSEHTGAYEQAHTHTRSVHKRRLAGADLFSVTGNPNSTGFCSWFWICCSARWCMSSRMMFCPYIKTHISRESYTGSNAKKKIVQATK